MLFWDLGFRCSKGLVDVTMGSCVVFLVWK